MKVENGIFYQVARNRSYRVGDVLHFGDKPNGQTKIFDLTYLSSKNEEPLHKIGFSETKKLLKSGSTIREMSIALSNYDLFMREIALEDVRKEKFPDLPSRFVCMFLSDDAEVARRNYFALAKKNTLTKDDLKSLQLIKVRVTGELFFVKDVLISREGLSYNEYKRKAVDFWSQNQDPKNKPHDEILFVGEAEVVEIIECLP